MKWREIGDIRTQLAVLSTMGKGKAPAWGIRPGLLREEGGLSSRMLPDYQYPIPQHEPLIGIIRNRRIQRSMANRNAGHAAITHRICCSDWSHISTRKGRLRGNVVEVWIGELPKQFIHSEVRRRAGAP